LRSTAQGDLCRKGFVELVDIEPIHVAAYVEILQASAAKPTVLATNPAHAVRGPKHVVKRGKTPVLTAEQARRLLDTSMSRPSWACVTGR
jgi:hypothetical protein